MNLLEIIGLIFIVLATIPVVVYLSAKMGSYGYLKGRELFESHKERTDAESPRETEA